VLWVAAVGLLSPLALYAGRPVMPLAALYGVAAGIALALALAGRRLHEALLQDALRGKGATGRALVAVGMMLLVLALILLGAIVAILMLFRTGRGTDAIPGLVGS
jgi:hypothetical protein